MESLCEKLFKSVFILPYVAGNYRRRQNGFWNYDCTISSRVLFLIIVALVIVFTASKELKTHVEVRLGFILLLLSVLMICTVFALCRLGRLVQKHGLQSVVSARRHISTPKLQMIFLWVFGLGSALYCALFVGKQIECSAYSSGGFYWNVLLSFNIILILSIISEMIFLTYFSPYQLKQTSAVNFSSFFLLTANISVVLYIYLMKDTFLYAIEIYPEGHFISCIESNSTMTILMHKSKQFLSPTFVEYAFLSITVVVEIWSPTKVHQPDTRSAHEGINDIENSEQNSLFDEFDNGNSERRSLLHAVANDESQQACLRQAAIEPYHSENGERRKVSHIITLVGSLTAGLGLVICYTAQAMDKGNIENIRYATEIYELTLIVVMVLVIFVGFYCLVHSCNLDRSAQPLRPGDYVYLLSAFGAIMFHMYEVIGGDVSSDSSGSVFLFKSIVSIFQDYLQIVFLLQANRCKKSRSSVVLLESVFIFTSVINLIYWFNNSFLKAEFPSTRILENDHFSKEVLDLVYKVLLPVLVFFRFTSFLEFYAILEEYKH
ncbi:uncharacterized protein LOC110460131 [Mizuhopecten yessoensis]|uniref:uncharacterized protein LOC110460131 n=1 Tax=Mizuhopecten yessoensis TaxID=6573 RepID=UPI000B45A03C|nr:uncharacterized protein LOC110460131 [Mizuhopecten yessoensis]